MAINGTANTETIYGTGANDEIDLRVVIKLPDQ